MKRSKLNIIFNTSQYTLIRYTVLTELLSAVGYAVTDGDQFSGVCNYPCGITLQQIRHLFDGLALGL